MFFSEWRTSLLRLWVFLTGAIFSSAEDLPLTVLNNVSLSQDTVIKINNFFHYETLESYVLMLGVSLFNSHLSMVWSFFLPHHKLISLRAFIEGTYTEAVEIQIRSSLSYYVDIPLQRA